MAGDAVSTANETVIIASIAVSTAGEAVFQLAELFLLLDLFYS
jgi:hypothetical protein